MSAYPDQLLVVTEPALRRFADWTSFSDGSRVLGIVTLTFRKSRACRWWVVTLLYGLTVLADAAPVVTPAVVTAMTAAATEPSILRSFIQWFLDSIVSRASSARGGSVHGGLVAA